MYVPAGGLREGQERNDGVTETLTEWTQVLSILYIITGMYAKSLLSALLLSLHCLEVPAGAKQHKGKDYCLIQKVNFRYLSSQA